MGNIPRVKPGKVAVLHERVHSGGIEPSTSAL